MNAMRTTLALIPFVAVACAQQPAPQPPDPTHPVTATPQIDWRSARPLPREIEYPAAFQQAIRNGTRTEDGRPGPRYWQQWTEYDVDITVHPADRRVDGTTSVTYHNRSPRVLPALVVELTQNLHSPGSPRSEAVEVTQGLELNRVAVAGTELRPADAMAELAQGPGYFVNGTVMYIRPPQAIPADGTVDLDFSYGFTIPEQGAGARMGVSENNLVFLAYFHPRMAVYDDVIGWLEDPFLANAEFYHGFGDYTYTVNAPAGWVVVGTGEHLNPEETLSDAVIEQLRRADSSDEIVQVIGPGEASNATRAGRNGRLVWHFEADSVRDIAVSLTRASRWDAARTPVGDLDGDDAVDYARADAIWRPTAPRWQHAARYTQHSIDFLSRFTGTPYPWPHMTAVEGAGIIGGGMEFPQMTLIGDYTAAGDSALYAVVAHELAHMWIPMIVSTNERRFAWFDEGATSFAENQARKEFYPGILSDEADRDEYVRFAGTEMEGEMMRRSDYHYPGPAYVIASYRKPATTLDALRELIGEDAFMRAYREFFDRWSFRHAYPYDFWNTVEDVVGEDLDWFWYSWYYTTWTLDQAVAGVESTPGGGAVITIEDRGEVPMPARVRITRADGRTLDREVPVETWLSGATRATIELPAGAAVTRVEIDPSGNFPDVDRTDNVWTSGG